MTPLEMQREFKIFMDKVDSLALTDFSSIEIYMFLNEAQERFIKTRYGGNNIYKQGFEEIQKRTDDLNNLVKTRFCQVSPVPYELNTYRVSLSNLFIDEAHTQPATEVYMFYVRGRGQHVATCGSEYIITKLVQQDDLEEVKLDPFKRPDLVESVGYFEDSDLFIMTDGSYSIGNYKLTFIKRPLLISDSQACELRDHTHKEIIQLAVQIALENIEQPRQNSQNAELNTIE